MIIYGKDMAYLGEVAKLLNTIPDSDGWYVGKAVICIDGIAIGEFISDDIDWEFRMYKAADEKEMEVYPRDSSN